MEKFIVRSKFIQLLLTYLGRIDQEIKFIGLSEIKELYSRKKRNYF